MDSRWPSLSPGWAMVKCASSILGRLSFRSGAVVCVPSRPSGRRGTLTANLSVSSHRRRLFSGYITSCGACACVGHVPFQHLDQSCDESMRGPSLLHEDDVRSHGISGCSRTCCSNAVIRHRLIRPKDVDCCPQEAPPMLFVLLAGDEPLLGCTSQEPELLKVL
jgi:hypothetical protein